MATQQARLTAFITAVGADIKALFQHANSASNPHSTTKAQVGLGSVDNTSDATKPISALMQSALDGKAAAGHSHSIADVGSLQATLDNKPSGSSAILTSQQSNSTLTPAVLTNHTFVVPPGKTLMLNGQLIFQSAAITTGAAYGVRVAQGAGANANAVGSWGAEVQVGAAALATAVRSGGRFNVAAGANALGETIGTGASATATDHGAVMQAVVKNQATNADTTVTVLFRSEVNASAITAQIGTAAVGVIV